MEKENWTLQKLAEYAEKARNKAEKDRVEKENQKQKACMEIVIRIIKELKTADAMISVRKVGDNQFNIGLTSYSTNISNIELEDIVKMIVNEIPALNAVYSTDNGWLEVSFAKVKAKAKAEAKTENEESQTKEKCKRWLRFFRKE